jgi:Protein of unknown function (DUF2637)
VSATTVAAADNAQARAIKSQLKPDSVTGEGRRAGLGRGQAVAVGVSVVLGLVVFGYGIAGSYVTVSDLAARRGVPLAAFVPAGIDGGLISVVVLDLVLVWVGAPVGWLRQVVRVLSVGTIAANAVTGWPDPVAVGLHAAAPTMLLAMIEAGRTVLLRRLGVVLGTARDAIPVQRWLLAPWRTALLWRRMVLWQITSYRTAVDLELAVRRAVARLRLQYGRGWRRRAPADLVWMLRTGVAVSEACTRVEELVCAEASSSPPVSTEPRLLSMTTDIAPVEKSATTSKPPKSAGDGQVLARQVVNDDDGRFAEAERLNREHWVQNGRPISAETLRKRLRLGAHTSRVWSRIIRAADKAAVCGSG